MQKKVTKAVALKYDQEKDQAPKIVASGTNEIANRIIELARASGIEIKQDDSLVEILSLLEVNSLIPVEAYSAVAEILAYVYKVNAQNK